MSPRELEHAGRLVQPLYAGADDDRYRAISWDEALDRVVIKAKATSADETFFYASGRSSNEAAFLLHLFARMYGTNNVNNCSYYCHQASGVGLSSSIGTGTATIVLDGSGRLGLRRGLGVRLGISHVAEPTAPRSAGTRPDPGSDRSGNPSGNPVRQPPCQR